MLDKTSTDDALRLEGSVLRDELKRLRTQIPDNPALNPILNVAFDLSRRLESGQIAYKELKNLAGRIMDGACVHRARRLRERIGYQDQATTLKDFTAHVEKTADQAGSLQVFAERWGRARTGIVLTAHPTFGLSDELYHRMVEIAVNDPNDADVTIGLPHRPSGKITLQHEHKCAQDVRPPTPEWGIMVADGAAFMISGECWVSAFPGLALMLTVLCFNLLGDGLRDIMDPRRRT